MILLIDNYDSFVWNLARYVSELGHTRIVVRNDATSLDDIAALAPTHIIVSPGPCSPAEAGISNAVITAFGETVPILGVCLGHQCIGAALGGKVARAQRPMHGKTSLVRHGGTGVFASLPDPLRVTRYHSLIVEDEATAGLPRGDGAQRGGRDHGPRPPDAADRGGSVPSGGGADRARPRPPAQFPATPRIGSLDQSEIKQALEQPNSADPGDRAGAHSQHQPGIERRFSQQEGDRKDQGH